MDSSEGTGGEWKQAVATIVRGHGVASGRNGDPRFPGGTIHMQLPHFEQRGLELSGYHLATINLSLAPCRYAVRQAPLTFRKVKWHPTEPAEDFSFLPCRLRKAASEAPVNGLIYYPHPETKPEHIQAPEVVEVLAGWMDSLSYGNRLFLEYHPDELEVIPPESSDS